MLERFINSFFRIGSLGGLVISIIAVFFFSYELYLVRFGTDAEARICIPHTTKGTIGYYETDAGRKIGYGSYSEGWRAEIQTASGRVLNISGLGNVPTKQSNVADVLYDERLPLFACDKKNCVDLSRLFAFFFGIAIFLLCRIGIKTKKSINRQGGKGTDQR